MRTPTSKRAGAVALIAATGLLLAGCGSSSGSSASSSSSSSSSSSAGSAGASAGPSSSGTATGGTTALKIGVSPTISSVDVLYAVNAGLFKQEGLDVTISVDTASGAATFPEVVNGQLQMTVVDPVSWITAVSKGLPLTMAAQGNVMASDPTKNYTGIMVKSGSSISSPKRLEGKTVAVNSLNSILELLTRITVDADGGDSSKVKFVEIPPANEVNAVAKGQTDALVNVEPLLTNGAAAGLTTLAHPPASVGGLPQDVLVTSTDFAKQNAGTVQKFQDAMTKANAALAANPSLIVTTANAQKEVTAAVASKIILPVFANTGTVSADSVTKLQALMVKYGYLKQAVPTATLLGGS